LQNLKNSWAYLERFRAENKLLKTQIDDKRLVFIGDSIVAGWNESPFFRNNPHYINRGINGQTTSQILVRFNADVLHLKPKCLLVLAGTNDIAENNGPIALEKTKHNFLSMIEIAKAHNIKIILCSVLPVAAYYWNTKIQPAAKIDTLNAFLTSLADEITVFYVDFYSSLAVNGGMNKNLSDDGVHPNALGYTLMSSILIQTTYI
jgi:alpha-L-fucosidase